MCEPAKRQIQQQQQVSSEDSLTNNDSSELIGSPSNHSSAKRSRQRARSDHDDQSEQVFRAPGETKSDSRTMIESMKTISRRDDEVDQATAMNKSTSTTTTNERLADDQVDEKTTREMQIGDHGRQDQNSITSQQVDKIKILNASSRQLSAATQTTTTTTTTTLLNYHNLPNDHSCDDNPAQQLENCRPQHHSLPVGANKRTNQPLKSVQTTKSSFAHDLPSKVFSILLISIILSVTDLPSNDRLESSRQHVIKNQNNGQSLDYHHSLLKKLITALPRIVIAGASECTDSIDCDKEKICHENKCICGRDKPIEDKERQMCLAHALVGDQCVIGDQCLGNSQCLEGFCSCGNDNIGIFNPSAKINYCHPKRRINQECSHDAQCPADSFCGGERTGCLCQNGFGPGTVSDDGKEIVKCLPKTCSRDEQCESIYHRCENFKCMCLATHFDPHTAKCYKFGSTGGKPADEDADSKLGNLTQSNVDSSADKDGNTFLTALNDLTKINGEENRILFIVILILIALLFLLLIIVFILLIRRHYLGYCWTMSKIGYEPNNQAARPQGLDDDDKDYFNKNSIKNKSFRKKRNVDGEETDDEDDANHETAADESNLVTTTTTREAAGKGRGPLAAAFSPAHTNGGGGGGGAQQQHKSSGYVKVDMGNGHHKQNGGGPQKHLHQAPTSNKESTRTTYGNHYQEFHHQVGVPLASSTSTPV